MFGNKGEKKVSAPFLGDKLPNSFLLLAIGLFGAIIVSFVVIVLIGFFNYLFTSFYLANTVTLIKYCMGLLFWVILSAIPLIGIVFVCKLPFSSIEIVKLLNIQGEFNVWFSFILLLIVAIGAFLFNSLSQIYLIREEYTDLNLKERNKKNAIIIYLFSVIIGLILIFTSDLLFTSIFALIIQA